MPITPTGSRLGIGNAVGEKMGSYGFSAFGPLAAGMSVLAAVLPRGEEPVVGQGISGGVVGLHSYRDV